MTTPKPLPLTSKLLSLSLTLAVALCSASARAAIPPFEQSATPESQGMSSAKLEALWQALLAQRTTALLVIRNDRIVLEKYAEGSNASKPHYTASLAKALVGGLSLALAIDDGLIALDDRAGQLIPQWQDDPK